MMPNYIRKSIDAITIDIPISFVSSAATNLSKFGMQAGMMNIAAEEEETGDSTIKKVLTEKNYIVNFLQKVKARTSMRT